METLMPDSKAPKTSPRPSQRRLTALPLHSRCPCPTPKSVPDSPTQRQPLVHVVRGSPSTLDDGSNEPLPALEDADGGRPPSGLLLSRGELLLLVHGRKRARREVQRALGDEEARIAGQL